jgi:isocitrate/isopropylmalate dehydrogenase
MMLGHLGLVREAAKIEATVLEAVQQKRTTHDVGGATGTSELGDWVAGKLGGS